MTGARRLRILLQRPGLIVAPGVYDGLSTIIVGQAGFEAVYASGGAIARSAGLPDLGLLSATEMASRIGEIVEASRVPVIADADTGYGNPLNVTRTVAQLERIGVAALHLEDQITPKKCGHYDTKSLITPAEMSAKIHAAVDARIDDDLLMIARTDAIAVEGFDAALARARAYANAGADMLFLEAPESVAQVRQIAAHLDLPLLINMFAGGKTPLMSAADLAELGYRLMIVPSDLQRAAISAMRRTADTLRRDGSTTALADQLTSFVERDQLIDLPAYRELERRYAT